MVTHCLNPEAVHFTCASWSNSIWREGVREAWRKRGRQESFATITRDNCSVIAHEISRNFEIVIPKTPNLVR